MSELLSAIDTVAAVDPHTIGSAGLILRLEELIEARDRLDALIARHLQAADAIDATVDECGRSIRGWLIEEMRRSPGEAKRAVFVARSLPTHPKVGAVFDTGGISAEHTRVIISCVRELHDEPREWATDVLVETARSVDPTALGQVVREIRLRTGLDEDREAAAQRMYADRYVKTSVTVFGMIHLDAMLDPEAGRIVCAALDALTAAPPDRDSEHADADTRTLAQRRADALADLAHYSLTGGVLPDHGGDRPTVMVTIDYQQLLTQITDTTGVATLNGPYGPTPITPRTARRIACDADIIPAILGGDGAILDLGRSQRTWTTAQRRAATSSPPSTTGSPTTATGRSGAIPPPRQSTSDAPDFRLFAAFSLGGVTDAPTPFVDLAQFVALPRVTSLALSAAGDRLVATIQQPDDKGGKYTSALWEIALDGQTPPARLTFSDKGESGPAFLPDGSLLFTSGRPDPGAPDEESAALWRLPAHGEAHVIARAPGGLSDVVVATEAGTVIASSSLLVGSADLEDDTEKRKNRKDRKVSAILHTGMPIRYWDAPLGDESPRLFQLDPAADEPTLVDLVPEARFELTEAAVDITADGTTVVSSWVERERAGQSRSGIIAIDVASGKARTLLDKPGHEYGYPRISSDGTRLAVLRETPGDYDVADRDELLIHNMRDGGESRVIDVGDLTATEFVWSPDSQTLYVAGDLHGRGAVLAVDGATGTVRRRLVSDAVYGNLIPTPDGTQLYALRSLIDSPPTPVRFAVDRDDQQPERLRSCDGPGQLPGTLTEVETDVDGVTVRGWLCLPLAADEPAPLMVWVHGGPHASWNSWSWRWNPWIAVQRGYGVLLPDPAMSTGYGQECLARGWPRRADVVWREVEALTDATLAQGGLDRDRTACLGASFGGYMTNWIAGHTDRFRAIVTHSGLWAADQQHTTTDAAAYKSRLWGTPEDHPDWFAENSPHHFVTNITTPMLVSHGDRDYRVPFSESLRLWWDLVSHYDGEPDTMPHRFLQFTSENHWVLSPSNSRIWYQTVLGFCDQHVRGGEPLPAVLPDW